MPSRAPLAVVLVSYQSAAVIGDGLRSVLAALDAAGRSGAPVLVVDNGSTDETLLVAAEAAPAARLLPRGRNDGFAAGVNAGVALVPGHHVLVLNPDVRLQPDALALLEQALTEPGVGIAVPRLSDPEGALHPSMRRAPTVLRTWGEALLGGTRAGRFDRLGEVVTDPAAYTLPGTTDWATGAAWLVSAECLDAVGTLDERYFLYSEETDFMLRAGDLGFAVRYEPAAQAVHIGGAQRTSPSLYALSVTNRVRLHRERHGRGAAARMRLAVTANEGLRAVLRAPGGAATHRAALRALLRMPVWPLQPAAPAGGPDWVCFAAQDWWYHNTAHSDFQLMRSVAEHRTVLVVNSIGMRMPTPGRSTHVARRVVRKLRSVAKLVRRPLPELPGFHVMSPLPLPFYGSPLLRAVNAGLVRAQVRLVCLALGIRRPVVVVTIPTAWDVVRPMRRHALVYNRSDRHSEFPEADRGTIEEMEQQLLRHSDAVVYASRALMSDETSLVGGRAVFLDHGVDVDHFRPSADGLPADLQAIPAPRIGFFGALDDYVVDFDLLERVARELPDASLVLIGDSTYPMDRLLALPNVHWLGRRPYADVPSYGSGFDVALMPWVDTPWIHRCNPIKLKEYLALGLPVVSTEFAELDFYRDRVRAAGDHTSFVAAVRETLEFGPLLEPAKLRTSVLPWSWASRAELLRSVAEG